MTMTSTHGRVFTCVAAMALLAAWSAAGSTARAQEIVVTTATSGTIEISQTWRLDDPGGTLDGPTEIQSGALVINRTTDGTLSAAISGDGTITKRQASTWVLAGDNTSFAGTFTLEDGGLEFVDNEALGDGLISFAGGVLVYTTNSDDWSDRFEGTNRRIATVGSSVAIYYSSQFNGGSLEKFGAGSLTLSPPEAQGNSFPGGVVISAGRLVLENEGVNLGDAITNLGVLELWTGDLVEYTNSSSVSGPGSIEKRGHGTVRLIGANSYTGGTQVLEGTLVGGPSSLGNAINNASWLVVDSTESGTMPGIISGAGVLEIMGSGAVTLVGNNTFTGPVILTDGSLVLGSDTALGSGGEILFNNGRLDFTAAGTTDPSWRFSSTSSQPFKIGVASGVEVTFASTLQSSGGTLEKYGDGTLVLAGDGVFAPYYDGGTTIYSGTLAGTSASILNDVSVDSGATLRVNEDEVTTFTAAVSGFGAFEKTGAGELVIDASVYLDAAEARILSGTLTGRPEAFSGALSVSADAVLLLNDVGTFAGSVTGAGELRVDSAGTVALTGTSILSGDGFISLTSGTLQTAGQNLGGDVRTSGGTLRFDQPSSGTFTGTIDASGARVEKAGAGTLSIAGRLDADDVSIEAGTLRLSSGYITNQILNSGTLEKFGAGGLDVLDVTAPIAGAIVVSEGTLYASSAVIPGDITTNGTLVFDEVLAPGTYAGTISGSGAFQKGGPEDLTLTAASTFTGPTDVVAGRLAVDGALANTAVTVFDGAELGGSGTIAGSVSVLGGGVLAPGSSIQSLATGTVTYAHGATFAYEVDSTNLGGLGTAADLLVVAGDLNLDTGNGAQLTLTDLNGTPTEFVEDTTVFAMINYTGAWNGGLFTYGTEVLSDGEQFSVGNQEWRIDYNYVYNTASPTTIRPLNFQGDYQPASGTQTFVAITAVPEPSTYCLALAGLAAVGWTAARRRAVSARRSHGTRAGQAVASAE